MASLGAGLALSVAVSALWRCRDDAFTCSMDPIFSAATGGAERRAAPSRCGRGGFIAPVVGLLVYAIIRNGGLEHFLANFERAARGIFQLHVPLRLTIAVQWLLAQRTPLTKGA